MKSYQITILPISRGKTTSRHDSLYFFGKRIIIILLTQLPRWHIIIPRSCIISLNISGLEIGMRGTPCVHHNPLLSVDSVFQYPDPEYCKTSEGLEVNNFPVQSDCCRITIIIFTFLFTLLAEKTSV